ncbi:hypothetical protein PPERSA_04309 [Pseudocohnilembus persalinus]|uniref:tRNA:m(4)X modification enzyme TRM13 n=1 Tax=Pseudocohnilembus persalinus TaxID=266149 RepID=A0A0V0QN71_PSEPJ|nr:hypothetical protein PPERSA_04309 [Pseudocohnilembus persalinus]|eukprot:KRX03801.1 hypothetical protein PPERSA_04309 [Pseudocohnilembus persalinus]
MGISIKNLQQNIDHCQYFLKKKNRFCNQKPKTQEEYCNQHKLESKSVILTCPYDKSHQILKEKYEQHIKKQNSEIKIKDMLKQESQDLKDILLKIPFIFDQMCQEYFEYLKQLENQKFQLHNKFENLTQLKDYLLDLEEKEEEQTYDEIQEQKLKDQQLFGNQNNQINYQQQNDSENTISQNQILNKKHTHQCQMLIKQLEQNKLVNNEYCYIEFGAGKGLLSSELAALFENKYKFTNSKHILIEREGRKHSYDKLHRKNQNWLRITTDIVNYKINQSDLNVSQDGENMNKLNIVGISKHMCGQATDLTINSLLNIKSKQELQNDQNKTNITNNCFFQGLMIATCCHQLCSIHNYGNAQKIIDFGIQKQFINIFFHISSWYLSVIKQQNYKSEMQKKYQVIDQFIEIHKNQQTKQNNNKNIPEFFEILDNNQKLLFGKMVKKIIDIGRILYLVQELNKQNDKQCKIQLLKYCSDKFSLENFIILMS